MINDLYFIVILIFQVNAWNFKSIVKHILIKWKIFKPIESSWKLLFGSKCKLDNISFIWFFAIITFSSTRSHKPMSLFGSMPATLPWNGYFFMIDFENQLFFQMFHYLFLKWNVKTFDSQNDCHLCINGAFHLVPVIYLFHYETYGIG